jgi:hypothetical protein
VIILLVIPLLIFWYMIGITFSDFIFSYMYTRTLIIIANQLGYLIYESSNCFYHENHQIVLPAI